MRLLADNLQGATKLQSLVLKISYCDASAKEEEICDGTVGYLLNSLGEKRLQRFDLALHDCALTTPLLAQLATFVARGTVIAADFDFESTQINVRSYDEFIKQVNLLSAENRRAASGLDRK